MRDMVDLPSHSQAGVVFALTHSLTHSLTDRSLTVSFLNPERFFGMGCMRARYDVGKYRHGRISKFQS